MEVQSITEECIQFKNAVVNKNIEIARSKLGELKEKILQLDSLNSADSLTEKKIVRDILEYAVILSIDCEDKESFQRYLSSLRPLYTTTSADIGQSELMGTILGLNLLHLLVENKLADFHCELELLSDAQKRLPVVSFCTQLDQHLMVGSYDEVNIVLTAAARPPVEQYNFFLKSLLKTVRVNIGDCIAAAYKTLSVAAATKMLMFSSDSETLTFIQESYPNWELTGITINLQGGKSTDKSEEIPALKIIQQQLTYANELERIV